MLKDPLLKSSTYTTLKTLPIDFRNFCRYLLGKVVMNLPSVPEVVILTRLCHYFKLLVVSSVYLRSPFLFPVVLVGCRQ